MSDQVMQKTANANVMIVKVTQPTTSFIKIMRISESNQEVAVLKLLPS